MRNFKKIATGVLSTALVGSSLLFGGQDASATSNSWNLSDTANAHGGVHLRSQGTVSFNPVSGPYAVNYDGYASIVVDSGSFGSGTLKGTIRSSAQTSSTGGNYTHTFPTVVNSKSVNNNAMVLVERPMNYTAFVAGFVSGAEIHAEGTFTYPNGSSENLYASGDRGL